MKTAKFLGDIDDPAEFAVHLENVYALQYEELQTILSNFPILRSNVAQWRGDIFSRSSVLHEGLCKTYEDLARMRHTMAMLIRDMSDRKRRLADRAMGLTDLVLDKESAEEELRADSDRAGDLG